MSMKEAATVFLCLVLGLALAVSVQAASMKGPTGGVLLTVAGDVAHVNRPAYDEKRDVLFEYHEHKFEKAFAFDRTMLEGLGVVQVRIEYAGWDGPKNLSGPRIVDVLRAAGCGNGPIATLALDGFGTEISAAKLAAHDWVLSTRADGRPHEIGGRGPLWLVFDPPGERPATAEEESMWPWSLFFIRCG